MSATGQAMMRLLTAIRDLRAARRQERAWRLVLRAQRLHPTLIPEIVEMTIAAVIGGES
jgi:hypothetical protein